jgi:hypothetical protein
MGRREIHIGFWLGNQKRLTGKYRYKSKNNIKIGFDRFCGLMIRVAGCR